MNVKEVLLFIFIIGALIGPVFVGLSGAAGAAIGISTVYRIKLKIERISIHLKIMETMEEGLKNIITNITPFETYWIEYDVLNSDIIKKLEDSKRNGNKLVAEIIESRTKKIINSKAHFKYLQSIVNVNAI